jgi:hypothetical protein
MRASRGGAWCQQFLWLHHEVQREGHTRSALSLSISPTRSRDSVTPPRPRSRSRPRSLFSSLIDGTGEARMEPIRGRAKRAAKNFMVWDVCVGGLVYECEKLLCDLSGCMRIHAAVRVI